MAWMPVFAALTAVGGGALAYWNQKRLDQNKNLIELRRKAYQRFVEAMVTTTSADARKLDTKDQAFVEFQRASSQMTLVALDKVLQCLAAFQNDRTMYSDDIVTTSENLFGAMREDVFEGTLVSQETVRDAFPIKFGERA